VLLVSGHSVCYVTARGETCNARPYRFQCSSSGRSTQWVLKIEACVGGRRSAHLVPDVGGRSGSEVLPAATLDRNQRDFGVQ